MDVFRYRHQPFVSESWESVEAGAGADTDAALSQIGLAGHRHPSLGSIRIDLSMGSAPDRYPSTPAQCLALRLASTSGLASGGLGDRLPRYRGRPAAGSSPARQH